MHHNRDIIALKRESLQEGNSKDKDNIEGGKQNGPGIRTDGRLSDSETESKSGTGGNGNEIRTSEGQISEGEIDGARTAMFLEER